MKVYKFWRATVTQAWWALTEEERAAHDAKVEAVLAQVGGTRIVLGTPAWANEEWMLCGVEEFPSVEAEIQHTMVLFELQHAKYMKGESWLAVEYPPAA
jgi:hypothetical protein